MIIHSAIYPPVEREASSAANLYPMKEDCIAAVAVGQASKGKSRLVCDLQWGK